MSDFNLSNESVCALISLAGTVSSALVAWLVAVRTSKNEIRKMKLAWTREDTVSSEKDFTEMVQAVTAYIQHPSNFNQAVAAEKVAVVRSKESGSLASLLDRLYKHIDDTASFDKDTLNRQLSKIIENKRNSKRE